MTITIEQNVSHGQLYLVADDGDEIRIPANNVEAFIFGTGIDNAFPQTIEGTSAQILWMVARGWEG